MDCTPEVRQIGLEQLAKGFGFDKTVLQIPLAVCIQERNADVCGYKLLGFKADMVLSLNAPLHDILT